MVVVVVVVVVVVGMQGEGKVVRSEGKRRVRK